MQSLYARVSHFLCRVDSPAQSNNIQGGLPRGIKLCCGISNGLWLFLGKLRVDLVSKSVPAAPQSSSGPRIGATEGAAPIPNQSATLARNPTFLQDNKGTGFCTNNAKWRG